MLQNRKTINESYRKATVSLAEKEITPLVDTLLEDKTNFNTPSIELFRELMYLEALFEVIEAYKKVMSITGVTDKDLEASLKDSNTTLEEAINLVKVSITSTMLDYIDTPHLINVLVSLLRKK